jgi:hypothetical protein
MKKLFVLVLALFVVLSIAAFAKDTAKQTTVTGWVTDPMCGAKGANAGHADCAKKCFEKGGKLAIVTDNDQHVWTVDNSDALKGHEGHHVKVTGSTDADKGTMHVSKVAMLGTPKASKSDSKHDESMHKD